MDVGAELERRYAAEFAEQERQEQEGHATVAAAATVTAQAEVAAGNGVALPATVSITTGVPQARARGEQRTSGRTTGHRVDVGTAHEVELAGEAGTGTDALGVLRVVNE